MPKRINVSRYQEQLAVMQIEIKAKLGSKKSADLQQVLGKLNKQCAGVIGTLLAISEANEQYRGYAPNHSILFDGDGKALF
jgi:hypothetical protein